MFHISHVSQRSESPVTAANAGVPGRAASSDGEYSAMGSRIEICSSIRGEGASQRVCSRTGHATEEMCCSPPRARTGTGIELTLMCQDEARAPLIARA